MSGDCFVTVYDPYRTWMLVPEAACLALALWLCYLACRGGRLLPGILGTVVGLTVAVAMTSQVPTPAWAILGGPAQVVEGRVEDLHMGKWGRFETLDFRVGDVPVYIYGAGRRAELVRLAPEVGGPIRDGMYVRVSLRAGKVLKFEVREGWAIQRPGNRARPPAARLHSSGGERAPSIPARL